MISALAAGNPVVVKAHEPDHLLPLELQNANPRSIWRTVNGQWTKTPVTP
jgi:hypothetical protein